MSQPRIAKFHPLSSIDDKTIIRMPQRATAGSAGYDIFLNENIYLTPGSERVIETKLKCEIDPGWFLQIVPRSGLGFKYQVRLANTVGIIDSDYFNNEKNEGHIMIKLVNGGKEALRLEAGSAFCQAIFLPYGITRDDNPEKEIRVGGFGSSGNTGDALK